MQKKVVKTVFKGMTCQKSLHYLHQNSIACAAVLRRALQNILRFAPPKYHKLRLLGACRTVITWLDALSRCLDACRLVSRKAARVPGDYGSSAARRTRPGYPATDVGEVGKLGIREGDQ